MAGEYRKTYGTQSPSGGIIKNKTKQNKMLLGIETDNMSWEGHGGNSELMAWVFVNELRVDMSWKLSRLGMGTMVRKQR